MPDAMEALRQHVQHEPADELARLQRHRLVPAGAFDPVIPVLEPDALLIGVDQAAVLERHAMRVAGEVGKHLIRPSEWTLRMDVPLGVIERLMKALNAPLPASPACGPKNLRRPASCAAFSIASILLRNSRDSTGTAAGSPPN